MAAHGYSSSIFDIPSLFNASVEAVIQNLHLQTDDGLCTTPQNIKQAILLLMSKRGLITDTNVDKVLTSRVRSLDLSASNVSDRCLFKLDSLVNLAKIDLNAFKDPKTTITSDGIKSLSKSCPHLQIVYLRRNTNVTDEGLIALTENCPLLRELDVGGCVLLTDRTLAALGRNSNRLKSCNIIGCQVTDDGINSLCQGDCSQVLTEIDMSGCKNLTDESVELLLGGCPQIKILLFARCPKISEISRVALEEKLFSTDGPRMKQVSWTIY